MAAPCFFAPGCLAADLATLGYPNADDPAAVDYSGTARLETLEWLACLIDPTFEDASPERLAAFWDNLGLHSAPKNNAGHFVPLTVTGEKQKERHGASLYLRTAIDLAMSFQRRRIMRGATEPGDGIVPNSEEEDAPTLDDNDILAMSQLESLLKQRASLFPSTIGLFEQATTKKRRPLAQRKNTMTNRQVSRKPPSTKTGTASKTTNEGTKKLKSRDELVERLRILQRDTEGSECVRSSPITMDCDSQDASNLDGETIRRFAQASGELARLVEDFTEMTQGSPVVSSNALNQSERDAAADERISSIAGDCGSLQEEIASVLATAEKICDSVLHLRQGRRLLECISNSSALRTISDNRRRLEGQLPPRAREPTFTVRKSKIKR